MKLQDLKYTSMFWRAVTIVWIIISAVDVIIPTRHHFIPMDLVVLGVLSISGLLTIKWSKEKNR